MAADNILYVLFCSVPVAHIQLLGVLSTAVLRPSAKTQCSEQERADIQMLVSFLSLHYKHVFKVCHIRQYVCCV